MVRPTTTGAWWRTVGSARAASLNARSYLGEINDSQKAAWRKSVHLFDEGRVRHVALFPEALTPPGDANAVGIRLNEP